MKRRLILGLSAAVAAAAVGLRVLRPAAPGGLPVVGAQPDRLLEVIGREFGARFLDDEETRAFVDAFAAANAGQMVREDTVVFAFIRATDVIRALETGEDLTYVGLEPLRDAPCRNTLSSWWL